jgi:hypothetical protein
MCLVRLCSTGFPAMWITLIITLEWDFAQIAVEVLECLPHPKQLHTTMACCNVLGLGVDRATIFCFLELQDTRDLLKNWQVLDGDFPIYLAFCIIDV